MAEIEEGVDRYKIIFFGDQSVGKTSFINYFLQNNFEDNQRPTIGTDIFSKTLQVNNKTVNLQLWDIPGQEKYQTLKSTYMNNTLAAIICFDVTNTKSFQGLPGWVKYVKEQQEVEILIYIVAIKIDLEQARLISTEQGKSFAKESGAMFLEVSSKTGHNIQQFFVTLSRYLQESSNSMIEQSSTQVGSLLNQQNNKIDFQESKNQKSVETDQDVRRDEGVTKYKIVFLGDRSVGKTSIISLLNDIEFSDNYEPTVGIDFISKTLQVDNKTVRLQLWDTAGQERFRSMIPSYIRDSQAAIICFDVTNEQSFQSLQKWVEDVQDERGEEVPIYIIGNKIDLKQTRLITNEQGNNFAKKLGVKYIEISAKNGDDIQQIFVTLSRQLLGNSKSIVDQSSSQVQLNLEESKEQESFKTDGDGSKQKIVFLGDISVGKTSILNLFRNIDFSDNYEPTVGNDFISKTLQVDNKTVRLQLWDTAGQERYRSLIPMYISNSQAAIICFDVTNEKSFEGLRDWVEVVKEILGDEAPIYIIGNKIDLEQKRIRLITNDQGNNVAKKLGAKFIEFSAKANSLETIQDLIINITHDIQRAPILSLQIEQHKEGIIQDVNLKGSILHHKIIFLGNKSVGKTSIIKRLDLNSFVGDEKPTQSIDFITKSLQVDDATVKFQLWDSSGSERFRSLNQSFIKASQAAIICFDVTSKMISQIQQDKQSFQDVKQWVEDVKEQEEEILIYIIGNKIDPEQMRLVTHDQGNGVSKDLGAKYIEVSAKTGLNLQDFLINLSHDIKGTKNVVKDKQQSRVSQIKIYEKQNKVAPAPLNTGSDQIKGSIKPPQSTKSRCC